MTAKRNACRRKGYGTYEVHGRTYRAWYYKPDPDAVSGFKRGPESTGIEVPRRDNYSDSKSYQEAVKNAEAQVETWLETRTAPYRLSMKHGKLINDKTQLKNALKSRINAINGDISGCVTEMKEADAKQPALTFQEAWEEFDRDNDNLVNSASGRSRDPSTHRNYKEWYGMFVKWTGTAHHEITELRGVNARIAKEYAISLSKQVGKSTYNRHLNCLSLIWRTLKRTDSDGKPEFPNARLGNDPFAFDKATKSGIVRREISKAEVNDHRRQALTLEEVHRLLSTAKGEMRGLIAIGAYCGWRLGDCVLVKYNQFNTKTWEVKNRSRKTEEDTNIIVHPALRQVLSETTDPARTEGYLFPTLAAIYNGDVNDDTKALYADALDGKTVGNDRTGRDDHLNKMILDLYRNEFSAQEKEKLKSMMANEHLVKEETMTCRKTRHRKSPDMVTIRVVTHRIKLADLVLGIMNDRLNDVRKMALGKSISSKEQTTPDTEVKRVESLIRELEKAIKAADECKKVTGRAKLTRMIQDLFHQCGIETSVKDSATSRARPSKGFHSLRHFLGTTLRNYGVNIEERKRILGHDTDQMAELYSTHYEGKASSSVLLLPDLVKGDGSSQPIETTTGGPTASIITSLKELNADELHKIADAVAKHLAAIK